MKTFICITSILLMLACANKQDEMTDERIEEINKEIRERDKQQHIKDSLDKEIQKKYA